MASMALLGIGVVVSMSRRCCVFFKYAGMFFVSGCM